MGKVQTSSRGSTKAFIGGGRSSRSVGKTLRGKKRLRPRKVIEGAQKKIVRPYGYQGHRTGGVQPRAQAYRLRQRRCRRSDSGTGHTRLATEKWVRQCGRSKIASYAVMVGGYIAEGATGFILRLNAEEQL